MTLGALAAGLLLTRGGGARGPLAPDLSDERINIVTDVLRARAGILYDCISRASRLCVHIRRNRLFQEGAHLLAQMLQPIGHPPAKLLASFRRQNNPERESGSSTEERSQRACTNNVTQRVFLHIALCMVAGWI